MGKPTDGELQAVVDVVQVAEMFAASTPIKVNGITRQLPNGIDDHPQHLTCKPNLMPPTGRWKY
jgi:hypothetical protein